jgi:23S rRNA (guanosine2251-2'-O)-methyltransferase
LNLVGCTEKTNTNYFELDLSGPTGLVLGSEEKGIRKEVIDKCHALGKLPVMGRVSSLNVSNAGAIAMYEVLRQKGYK